MTNNPRLLISTPTTRSGVIDAAARGSDTKDRGRQGPNMDERDHPHNGVRVATGPLGKTPFRLCF